MGVGARLIANLEFVTALVLRAAIAGYRLLLSPVLGPCCRFQPTCSAYACEALATHGVLWGSLLAIWRLLRCNPLCKGGDDPVPDSITFWPGAQARGGGGRAVKLG